MSLSDPQEAAKRKQESYRRSSLALSTTLVFGLLVVLAAAVMGFAVGGLVDQFRLMSVNSVFGTRESGMTASFRAVGLPLSILALFLFVTFYATWNHRYSGERSTFVIAGPVTIVLAGLTFSTWAATRMWTPPDAIGVAVDPTFGRDEPWGVGEWILYWTLWWLPGLLAVLTLLGIIVRIGAQSAQKKSRGVVEELLRSGRLVEAEVTEAPLLNPQSPRTMATLGAKFDDAAGVTRWVACTVIVLTSQLPAVGSRRPLLYDPRNPGDVSRIFFSPTGGTDAASFKPVREPK